jgi:molybdate transport system regulatory protein
MDAPHLTLDAELTLRVGADLLANAKRIELLRQIGLTENLTQSARIAGYSYKGAWDAIEQMTQLTGATLLERHAGGKGGGRTRLTERGKQLLKNFMLVQSEHARFISRLNKLANGFDADYAQRADIALKTSARNQFAGIIVSMLQGPVNDEVTMRVHDSLLLTASITHGSGRELGLEIGAKAFALVKASWIAVEPLSEGAGRRNTFAASIRAIVRGDVRSEATLLTDAGVELVVTLPNGQVDTLGLQHGARVLAVVDPVNVIVGVAA